MKNEPSQAEINHELSKMGIVKAELPQNAQCAMPAKLDTEADQQRGFKYTSPIGTELFISLAQIFGELWSREHGDEPSEAFNRWSTVLNPIAVQRILSKAQEQLVVGNRFPPPMGELILWGEMPSDVEFEEIMSRVLTRAPKDDIEKWIVTKQLFDLRRMSEAEMTKALKRYYNRAISLQKIGKLFPEKDELLALPVHSTKSLTDKKIEEFVAQGGRNPFQAKINAIRGKKL